MAWRSTVPQSTAAAPASRNGWPRSKRSIRVAASTSAQSVSLSGSSRRAYFGAGAVSFDHRLAGG